MKQLGMLTRFVFKEKRDIVLSILAGFIAGMAAVGLFSASGYLISKAALKPPLYALIILTSTVKLLGFTRALARYGERYMSHRATFTILSNLRVFFFKKLEPLAPRIFGRYRSGDLLSRITGDVETLQHYFLRVLYPPIILVMVFLSTILFTLYFSVATTIILLIGLALTTFVVPFVIAIQQKKSKSKVRHERSKLMTNTAELLHGFRDLKIYQKLSTKEKALNDTSAHYIHEQEKEATHILFGKSINTFISLTVTWAVLAIGAYLVTRGELDGIFLAMLVMIAITVFEEIDDMAILPIYLNDSKEAAGRLQDVVGMGESAGGDGPGSEGAGPDMTQPHTTGAGSVLPEDTAFSFDVDGVSFTFPDDWRTTLNDVTLYLPAGSKTAIVGPSGSGKSALLHLLIGIYPVDAGTIQVAGMPSDTINQEDLWRKSNVVLQDNHFFYGTIRSNLQLAGDALTDRDMKVALEHVQLNQFSLSDPVYEKGENLSGGEKQRLAITRALLKGGRNWFLDEPTSSIDALTEDRIYNHLFERAKDDTVVLVSHSLRGLEKMDQIIVVDHGHIIESGTFSELMQKEGYFYKMKEIERELF